VIAREQAKKVWEKRLAESKASEALKTRMRTCQGKMLDFLFDYSKINAKYLKEWNKLCAARDRAYLATYEKDWGEVVSAAAVATTMAPHETEAHVLLVQALLERGEEADVDSAKAILGKYIKEHQGQQAPAYLLRGVIEMNNGNLDAAILDFDQAAAYYPKQQAEMSDRLNLYKKRMFLNKSKEGRMILNLYRGVMSGSGYFSPDFQKARVFLKKGDKKKTRKKIFDHFFRRRLQGQWDRVLQDFRFCKTYLEADFNEIFKGDDLELQIEPAWFRNTLIVSIKNAGNRPIHNLTLLLCVRFTDMFKGDYISFPIGDSVAIIPPKDQVEVGRKNISDVTKEKLGTEKKWKDIIEYGAILISDELIAWIAPRTPTKMKKNTQQPPGDDSTKTLKNQAKTAAKKIINTVIDNLGEKTKGETTGNEK
jgi:tetratricopeptide (TPR) repeat protein